VQIRGDRGGVETRGMAPPDIGVQLREEIEQIESVEYTYEGHTCRIDTGIFDALLLRIRWDR
jgi:hypothetical protein